MKSLYFLIAMSAAFAAPPSAKEQAAVLKIQRNAANDQIALANLLLAQQQAQGKAAASQETAKAALDDLGKKCGCEIDPITVECKPKPEPAKEPAKP